MKNLIIKEKLFEIKVKKETIDKDIQTDKEEFEQLTVLEKCEVNESVYEKTRRNQMKSWATKSLQNERSSSGSRMTVNGTKRIKDKPSIVKSKKISKLPFNQRFNRNSKIEIKQRIEETKEYRGSFHNKSF